MFCRRYLWSLEKSAWSLARYGNNHHAQCKTVSQVLLVRLLQAVLKVQLYVAVCPVGFVVITNLRISQLNQHTCPLVQDASEG